MMTPAELAPGVTFAADFRVVRPLSRGGMGSVYVVDQLSTGRQRALKLMHPDLAQSPELRRRFEQEARVGARIASDHVVEVIAAGVDDATAMPWLAMELLDGEDLASALSRRGTLTLAEVAEILSGLCHALAAAHDAGVVHRDLKPENVFLATSRSTRGAATVKVLDFGIAKVVAEANTAATAAVGTPLYMAPEQTTAGGSVTPATDVWAVGLIAFRMLTGHPYWRGGNIEPTNAMAVLREVVMDDMPSASRRAQELGSTVELPPGFDAWFARATQREPSARYGDAREAFRAFAALAGVAPLDAPVRAVGQPPGPVTQGAAISPFEATMAATSATPSPLVATHSAPARASLPGGAGRVRTAAGIGALIVGAGTAAFLLLRPGAPATSSEAPRASAPTASAGPAAPEPAVSPRLHICEAARGDAGSYRSCHHPDRAWCDAKEEFVACCGKGLVPSGSSGACMCPPGGAIDPEPIAAGCRKVDGPRGLAREVVSDVIRGGFPRMRQCYERALEQNEVLKGRIELWLEVTPWGDVFTARIRSSTLPDPAAQECALAVVRALRFPPLAGGGVMTLAYPITFSPE